MHNRRGNWLCAAISSSWPVVAGTNVPPTSWGIQLTNEYGPSVCGVMANGLKITVDANTSTVCNATALTGGTQDQMYVVAADECHLWEDPNAHLLIRAEQPAAASLGVLACGLRLPGLHPRALQRRVGGYQRFGLGNAELRLISFGRSTLRRRMVWPSARPIRALGGRAPGVVAPTRILIQCLHLRFLVDAQHNRRLRRVHIQPDHIADLHVQLRIGGELERLPPPRLQVPLPPDPRHRGERDPRGSANSRADQCLTPRCSGGGVSVSTTTAASSMTRGRPERARSSAFATLSPASNTIRTRCAVPARTLDDRVNDSNRTRSPSRSTSTAATIPHCPESQNA